MSRLPIVVAATFLAGLVAFAACVTPSKKAPALSGIKPDVKTVMGRLATSIREVEEVLQSDASLTPGDYEKIATLLEGIDGEAKQLDPSSPAFAHPDFSAHLTQLRTHSEGAVAEARMNPPKFDEFGRLIGVCNQCHALQRL